MGTWGTGIRQDDFVLDVQDMFKDLLRDGKSIAEATTAAETEFSGDIKELDTRPLFWIALADVQWKYGELDPSILERIIKDYDSCVGMEPWGDPAEKIYQQRRIVVSDFIAKISKPNPKPARKPKRVVRRPTFKRGDCLAYTFEDGRFGAALVVAELQPYPEFGENLAAVLDFLSTEKPSLEVFSRRNWLKVTQGRRANKLCVAIVPQWTFKTVKHRIQVVGSISILDTDPSDADFHEGWDTLWNDVLLEHHAKLGSGSNSS